ncbi:putative Homing HNH endonuclase [Vibrio phage 275E43-1]|nr:putative Homing HNH endonuclase [Vibrio phage 275E43-1]
MIGVPDYPNYAVDLEGGVHNLKTGRKLACAIRGKYRQVYLYHRGKGKRFYVHRLVAELYLCNPNRFPVVNHKDGNRLNNSVSNLEWCTQQHNVEHGLSKHYTFVSPEGKVVVVFNLRKFCEEEGLHKGHLYSVHSGTIQQYKGWRKYA